MDFTLENLWEFLAGTVWPIIEFLIGISAVIVVHEFGHFIAARLMGIKVERFALGLGPRIAGIRTSETDYCLCAFPLGGYVKMLGQDDFAPREEGDDAADNGSEVDPRSYNAKSVGQRLFVISMGVVLNVIFAALLFILICMVGMEFPAPVVGAASKEYQADEAELKWSTAPPVEQGDGLKPGDRILSLDGREVERFSDIHITSVLAESGETFDASIQRSIDGGTYTADTVLKAVRLPGSNAPKFGIVPAASNIASGMNSGAGVLKDGERVTMIAGQKVDDYSDIEQIEKSLDSTRPVEIAVEGRPKTLIRRPAPRLKPSVHFLDDGSRIDGGLLRVDGDEYEDADGKIHKVDEGEHVIKKKDGEILIIGRDRLEGGGYLQELDILGMEPRIRVSSVLAGSLFSKSPAEKAGLRPGDVIIEFGERLDPTFHELQDICGKLAGKTTSAVILRDGEKLKIDITVREVDGGGLIGITRGTDLEHLVVAGVRPNSPAASAGIEPRSKITHINDMAVENWYDLFDRLCELRGEKITLTVRNGKVEKKSLGMLDESAFRAEDYRLALFPNSAFRPLMVEIKHTNPVKAVGWGVGETYRLIITSYASIRSLVAGDVSPSEVRGPVGIGEAAVVAARESLIKLVYLMAIISTAVAVFNFLPLPVLDGGHAALLIIEKIRGRPLPLRVINIIQMTGLVLILTLLVLITCQDCSRFF